MKGLQDMADRYDNKPESDEDGQSVFDLFEPPPPADPNSFGKIPVSCATSDGVGTCSVEWQSSNPRLPFTGTEFLTTIQNTACPVFLPSPSFGPCPVSLGAVSLVNALRVKPEDNRSWAAEQHHLRQKFSRKLGNFVLM